MSRGIGLIVGVFVRRPFLPSPALRVIYRLERCHRDSYRRPSSNIADAETDGSKRGKIHGSRIGDLQKQRLIRLLELRPLKDDHAIGPLSCT